LASARHIPRLLSRTHLRAYLGDLEWAEIGDPIGAGRIPSPVWGRKSSDAKARCDIREVDRYIDRAAMAKAHQKITNANWIRRWAVNGHRARIAGAVCIAAFGEGAGRNWGA
jgi:hypothetical protein